MNDNKTTGQRGEDLAAEYLLTKGYTLLARNWRFRHWEVDIIANRDKYLHFIEVKTRTSLRYGQPEESITREKMVCLRNIAEEYQYQHPEWQYIQFDVIAITITGDHLRELFVIEDVYF
jgi:putative endonuclease